MTIQEREAEIIEEFSVFDDWMDKYSYLIDLGNELEPYNDEYRKEEYLIKGCQSQVWLNAEYKDDKVYYSGDGDAIIVKGIVAILINVLSGHTPEEILECDFSFIDKIGLKEHLSPTRSNGLNAMIKQMRLFALAIKSKK